MNDKKKNPNAFAANLGNDSARPPRTSNVGSTDTARRRTGIGAEGNLTPRRLPQSGTDLDNDKGMLSVRQPRKVLALIDAVKHEAKLQGIKITKEQIVEEAIIGYWAGEETS